MGVLDWLRSLFAKKTVSRGVARIGTDLERVEEVVRLDGGPLKPGHRRRALRDRRLLPKPRPVLGKKKPVMSSDEATRLFAGTLRTTNRGIRDLTTDEEALTRNGLPIWRTEADVAAALGITVGRLRHFAIHRERERVCHYTRFAIPKRSGGERIILAPKRRLKELQRKLDQLLVKRLPIDAVAHGFVPGRSVRTGAAPHVGAAVLVHLDLTDFFPTITYPRVRGLFLALGYAYPVAATLAVLTTEPERQPVEVDGALFHVPVGPRTLAQGAPTSPGLANAVARRLDRRLGGLARKLGFAYTRYADDLSFSGADPAKLGALLGGVRRIVRAEGFRLNDDKQRIARAGRRQAVTGVTVNHTLGLSRVERRRIRAEIHAEALASASGAVDPGRRRALDGRLAYLAMLSPEQAERLRRRRRGSGSPG